MGLIVVAAAILSLLSLGIGLWVISRPRASASSREPATGASEDLSFQETRERLSLADDAELKALVLSGELRGYRAGASIKFRADEVEALRAKRAGVEVRKAGSAAQERCPFCHDRVEALEQVVCVTCLARHHEACWDEHTQCATCGARERFTGVEQTAGRSPRPQGNKLQA